MIDPELKYCPRCRDEYVAQAMRCAGCSLDLVLGRDLLASEAARASRKAGRSGRIEEGDELVMIHRDVLAEIKKMESLLVRENIAVMLTGDEKSCGKSCCPTNFYISVKKDDALDAMNIIRQELDRATRMDDHDQRHIDSVFNPAAGQVQCPACGTVFTPTSAECPDCGLCF